MVEGIIKLEGVGVSQRRDCTTRATAKAFNMSYEEAEILMQKHGKRPNFGFPYDDFIYTEFESAKHTTGTLYGRFFVRRINYMKTKRSMTAATFAKRHQKGTYILLSANHVAALIDGIIYDTWDSKKKILKMVYVITPRIPSAKLKYNLEQCLK